MSSRGGWRCWSTRESDLEELVSPGLKGENDCKELSVIDVIDVFCWDKGLEKIRARVPVTIRVGLEENGARGIF